MKSCILAFFVSALAAVAAPAAAQGGCAPEFFRAAKSVTAANLIVGRSLQEVEKFNIRVRNTGDSDAPCTAFLRFARVNTSLAPSKQVFTLRSNQRIVDILPNEGFPGSRASDIPILRLSSETNGLAIPFRLIIPTVWGIKEGSIVDQLVVSLVNEDREVVDTMLLTITLNFPPVVEMRLVGATGRGKIARINLGRLDPSSVTRSDPFGLRVWSTSPYNVAFRSQNSGQLTTSDTQGRIEYQLLMNGDPVSLMGATPTSVSRGTGIRGDFHRLRVRVPQFRSKAGDYSDRVEVTVSTI